MKTKKQRLSEIVKILSRTAAKIYHINDEMDSTLYEDDVLNKRAERTCDNLDDAFKHIQEAIYSLNRSNMEGLE